MEVPPNDQVSDLAQIATPVTNIPEYLRNIQYTRRRVPDNEVQTSESSMDTRASDTTEVEHFRLVDTYVGNNSPANVIIFLFIRNTLVTSRINSAPAHSLAQVQALSLARSDGNESPERLISALTSFFPNWNPLAVLIAFLNECDAHTRRAFELARTLTAGCVNDCVPHSFLRALPTAEILNGHPVEQNMDILTYVDRQRKVEKVIGTCPRCGASSVERVVVSSPSGLFFVLALSGPTGRPVALRNQPVDFQLDGRCLLLYAVIQQDPDIPTLFTYWKREGQRLLHYVRNEAKPEDELPRDLSNVHMLIWVVSDSA